MMNCIDEAFLIGCCLGDGYLGHHSGTTYLNLIHCYKQKDFLIWKADRLNTILNRKGKVTEFLNNGYPGVRYGVGNKNMLSPLYSELYPDGRKKIANERLINLLTPEALAVWWMDDGSCSKKYRRGKVHAYLGYLSTYETFEDNAVIVSLLNAKFNLNLKSVPDKDKFRIMLNTNDLRQLKCIIEPFVIESMKYKIDVRESASSPSVISSDNGQ